MNKDMMKAAGFGKQVERFEQGKCVFCKKPIFLNDFRNEISKREYGISGMCQECQDKIFGKD
jgi:hypothetical protein